MLRADGPGILIAAVGKAHQVVAQLVKAHDFIDKAFLGAEQRPRRIVVMLDHLVHLVDDGSKRPARVFFLDEPSGIACRRRGFPVHDVDLGRGGAE